MNNPCQIPLKCDIGTDFYLPIVWQFCLNNTTYPVDLSGYTAQMQVRPTVNSTGTPLVDVSTANSNIIISGPTGQISIYIPNSITSGLPEGCFVYDLKVVNNVGLVEKLFGGSFTVKGMVTR